MLEISGSNPSKHQKSPPLQHSAIYKKKTPWPESASDRRLSAKLVPLFAERERCVVSAMDPHDCILGFLDQTQATVKSQLLYHQDAAS
jgi:hypothetical protein